MRKKKRIIIVGSVLLLLLAIVVLPPYLFSSFVENKLRTWAEERGGKVSMSNCSVGWLQGISCRDVEYTDQSMGLDISVDNVSNDRGLLALVLAPGNLGTVRADDSLIVYIEDGEKKEKKILPGANIFAGLREEKPFWEDQTFRIETDGGKIVVENSLAADFSLRGFVSQGEFTYAASCYPDISTGSVTAKGKINLPLVAGDFFSTLTGTSEVSFDGLPLLVLSEISSLFPRKNSRVLNGNVNLIISGKSKVDVLGNIVLKNMENEDDYRVTNDIISTFDIGWRRKDIIDNVSFSFPDEETFSFELKKRIKLQKVKVLDDFSSWQRGGGKSIFALVDKIGSGEMVVNSLSISNSGEDIEFTPFSLRLTGNQIKLNDLVEAHVFFKEQFDHEGTITPYFHPLFGVISLPEGNLDVKISELLWRKTKGTGSELSWQANFDVSRILLQNKDILTEVYDALKEDDARLQWVDDKFKCSGTGELISCQPVKLETVKTELVISGNGGWDKSIDYLLSLGMVKKVDNKLGNNRRIVVPVLHGLLSGFLDKPELRLVLLNSGKGDKGANNK